MRWAYQSVINNFISGVIIFPFLEKIFPAPKEIDMSGMF